MLGRVFQRAYDTCRKPAYTLPALIVPSAVVLISRFVAPPRPLPTGHVDPHVVLTVLLRMLAKFAVQLVGLWPSATLLSLALATMRGGSASFARQWVRFGVFLRILLVQAVIGVVALIGLLLLFVPGVLVIVVWSQVQALLVDGRATFFDALEASQDLTRGSRSDVFAVVLSIFVMSAIVVGVTLGFSMAIGVSPNSWVTTVDAVVLGAPLAAFSIAVSAALYLELVASEAPLTRSTYFLAPVDYAS